MSNKTTRQLAIKELVSSHKIHSQTELLNMLREQGFELTQATLSRDLKTLKVAKVPDGETQYFYSLSKHIVKDNENKGMKGNLLVDGFKSISFSKNIAVIKTIPGYASSIAAVLDNDDPYEILGTVAGDDIIIIVMKENVTPNDLKNRLILIMPKLRDKLNY